jgi:DNA-binding NarL/FixJ family response regulator
MYTILILDDELKHLCATRDYLILTGFNVLTTNTPFNALSLLEKVVPDILILDIMMPKIDGYSFLKKLKSSSHFSRIPFIFLTAKGMTQDRIKGYKLGCSGYLCKPFDPEELVALIKNILTKEKEREKEIVRTIQQIYVIRSYLENQYRFLKMLNLNLTQKEAKVLNYVLKGFKNKEIAVLLETSVRNIEKYVSKLLNKTNTQNRTSLVRFIYLTKFNSLI